MAKFSVSLSKEINEIGARLRGKPHPHQSLEDGPLRRLLASLLNAIYEDNRYHYAFPATEFNKFAPFFSLPLQPEGATVNIPTTLQVVDVSADQDEVVVSIIQSVTTETSTEEPVMEWVLVDENTKVRRQASDSNGKLRTKRSDPRTNKIEVVFAYHFPMDLFVELFKEIGRDSIGGPLPKDYVPKPLGLDFSRIFGPALMDFEMAFDKGYDGFGSRRGPPPRMMMDRMMRDRPVRVFLKPEKGTDRLEVMVEPYSRDEIEAHRNLTARRKDWIDFRVRDTKAVREFVALFRKTAPTMIRPAMRASG
jgi:hypothetical protein